MSAEFISLIGYVILHVSWHDRLCVSLNIISLNAMKSKVPDPKLAAKPIVGDGKLASTFN